MPMFQLQHRHEADECATIYAAWRGFASPLRRSRARSSCPWGDHQIWWEIEAAGEREALELLPPYVADRTVTVRIAEVDIP